MPRSDDSERQEQRPQSTPKYAFHRVHDPASVKPRRKRDSTISRVLAAFRRA